MAYENASRPANTNVCITTSALGYRPYHASMTFTASRHAREKRRPASRQAHAEEVDREEAEHGPHHHRRRRTAQPADLVPERHRGRQEMGELRDDVAGVGIVQEHAHEPEARSIPRADSRGRTGP